MRLMLVGTERRERADPFLARPPVIERALFRFGGIADGLLGPQIVDSYKSPRLLMGAARCGGSGSNRLFDEIPRDGLARKVSSRAPESHLLIERRRPLSRLLRRSTRERQRYEFTRRVVVMFR